MISPFNRSHSYLGEDKKSERGEETVRGAVRILGVHDWGDVQEVFDVEATNQVEQRGANLPQRLGEPVEALAGHGTPTPCSMLTRSPSTRRCLRRCEKYKHVGGHWGAWRAIADIRRGLLAKAIRFPMRGLMISHDFH